ncbi:unnamed protein product [Hymenolepis diminuta]|uniref:Uncharacterized protein n=1 Tax=Hymenolepis diminuta TaxID=6216 RepID=A0A564YHR0_HYMDI|nr:unnamed protein product [Hymenolepis diminuta]
MLCDSMYRWDARLKFLEKTIFRECYVTYRNINLMGLGRKRNPSDIYSRTYECGKSRERMQLVSTCCQNPSSIYSYSIAETGFSQNSALTYHFGSTKGAAYTVVTNSHSKGSNFTLLSPTTSRSAISNLNKLVVYQKRSLRTQIHSLAQHFPKFCSYRSIIHLRRSLAVLGPSTPQQNLKVKV